MSRISIKSDWWKVVIVFGQATELMSFSIRERGTSYYLIRSPKKIDRKKKSMWGDNSCSANFGRVMVLDT